MSEAFQSWAPRRIDEAVEAAAPAPTAQCLPEDISPWSPPDMTAPLAVSPQSLAAKASNNNLAAQELDNQRELAKQEGYQEGLRLAEAESHQLLGQQSQQLQNAIAALSKLSHQLDDALESEIAALSVGLACQLLRRELTQLPGNFLEHIHAAATTLTGLNGKLEVYLNPDDMATLEGHVADTGQELEPNWQLIEDPSITAGGFKLSDDSSRIDETLETRLAKIVRQAFAGSAFIGGGEHSE
ncbi:flagellar biosynthesis/type III secretory pathway protein [Spongiibacter sp. IMCC21906]|jgi:flagellar assembly protein FliH|uniref:FliH/SctL family protein n=1 Tax=Spongiibacter sp. IMCC21906 TaxID=1620392 RepID=UPI00062DD438|nr:FliH/SctL family protein [Spongiibacter sp. IMCC21906]AKH69411.1 flagellar biosynthesis/type III secretory pathway protein [Spongiibacter sp. IMCC21906]